MSNVRHKAVIDFARKKDLTIEVTKNSTNRVLLDFYCYNNGDAMDIADVTVASIKAVTPAGSTIYNETSIVDDTYIEYPVSENIMSVTGKTTCVLQLFDTAETLLNSFEFYITVYPSLFDEQTLVTDDDISAFQAYLTRAESAAETAETDMESFEEIYGTTEQLLVDLKDARDNYITYFTDFKNKVAKGEFNGSPGAQGEAGADAVIATSNYIYGFQIQDGDLYCYYMTDEEPSFSMSDDGYLIADYGE